MSYEFHENRSDCGERRADRGLLHGKCQRPFVRSMVSAAWPLICSIGLIGISVSTTVCADEPASTPGVSASNVALRPGQRGSRTTPQAANRPNRYADTGLSATLPQLPTPSPETAQTPEETVAQVAGEDRPAPAPLSSELIALQAKIRRALVLYAPKHQNTKDNSAWEVMHEIIAFGVDAQLFRGGPKGPQVNAIGWLCYNGSCKGEQMLYLDHDKLVARKGPGLQGHFGQFLAILAQSRLPIDYPMLVHGKSFTIADLVEHEKADCQPGEELTFKLIGLMHYLDSDATWTSRNGDEWSISRLIKEELKQPIRGAACGGTHRLMGFSYAVNKRILRGKPVTGEFRRAQDFINEYHRYTFGLQNPDGSFSTQWFSRREAKADVDRRLRTTGHIAEWLAFSLSDEDIRDPRMVKAMDYLTTILLADQDRNWEIGPVGHGLHALAIYDARLASVHPPAEPTVARLPAELPSAEPSSSVLPSDATPNVAPQSLRPAAQPVNDIVDTLKRARKPPCEIGNTSDEPSSDAAQTPPPAASPIYEVAEKLRWGMPPCEIGNESAEPVTTDEDDAEIAPPDAAIAPGNADDEMCL